MPAAEPQAPTTPVEQPSQATPPAAGDSPAATATTVTDLESGVLLVLPERVAEPADEPPTDSFVQQFPLPDGGSIELGGVAWSETGPFALINGRVVSPGSVVEEYTVERIGPTHVILSGDGRRVRISLQ
jgi:hypothetical protein